MLTIEKLEKIGADTKEGLGRCMGNEAFYFRLIGMAAADPGFEKLDRAVQANDLDAAFEAAHALKGVLGNLSLTQLYAPVSALTELLRGRTPGDYRQQVAEILRLRDELKELCV